jgi:hypothetical protein
MFFIGELLVLIQEVTSYHKNMDLSSLVPRAVCEVSCVSLLGPNRTVATGNHDLLLLCPFQPSNINVLSLEE